MTISRLEQETIIGFNEAEATASVYTHNGALKRKLEKLAKERPADVQLSRRYPEGAVEYTIPKRWVRVNATRILSEAQREAALKNVKAARMAKLG